MNNVIADLLPDILALAGVALIGYGLWIRWPWLAYVVVGAILLTAGVYPYVRKPAAASTDRRLS